VIRDGHLGAHRVFDIIHAEVNFIVERPLRGGHEKRVSLSSHTGNMQEKDHKPLFLSEWFDALLDARNEDLAIIRDESGKEMEEVRHGLVDCPSKHARMEIVCRPRDGDTEIRDPAETVSCPSLTVSRTTIGTQTAADGLMQGFLVPSLRRVGICYT
jgi:hypothetical protein